MGDDSTEKRDGFHTVLKAAAIHICDEFKGVTLCGLGDDRFRISRKHLVLHFFIASEKCKIDVRIFLEIPFRSGSDALSLGRCCDGDGVKAVRIVMDMELGDAHGDGN